VADRRGDDCDRVAGEIRGRYSIANVSAACASRSNCSTSAGVEVAVKVQEIDKIADTIVG